ASGKGLPRRGTGKCRVEGDAMRRLLSVVNPLHRNGGGLGRGKPRLHWRKSSLAAPTPSLPRSGGGGFHRCAMACAVAFALLPSGAVTAQDPTWQRGRDGRFEVAMSRIAAGSTLGFWCSAYQVPNTAIIGLRNVLLAPQLSDGEHYDMRF